MKLKTHFCINLSLYSWVKILPYYNLKIGIHERKSAKIVSINTYSYKDEPPTRFFLNSSDPQNFFLKKLFRRGRWKNDIFCIKFEPGTRNLLALRWFFVLPVFSCPGSLHWLSSWQSGPGGLVLAVLLGSPRLVVLSWPSCSSALILAVLFRLSFPGNHVLTVPDRRDAGLFLRSS